MKSIKFLFVLFVVVLLTLVVVPIAKSNTPPSPQVIHWDYKGADGPNQWGNISPTFAACKLGKEQSPVDLAKASTTNLATIEMQYKDTPFKIINNGSTIKVDYAPGSFIKIAGKQYELLQFHFHAPSEHTVDGKKYPIEAHFVHKAQDGALAVIGVFLKEGKPNDFIHTLWANLPEQEGEKTVNGISLNANALIPNDKSYYHYSGSLTTPPCSEGVSWNVLKTPIEVSQREIARFSSIYKGNARPIQPLNQRIIEMN